jgi:hypothetical protein
MLTANEIKELNARFIANKNEEAMALLITMEKMIAESYEYKQTVLRKLTTIETDMGRLLDENEKQIAMREAAFVERDSCVGLLIKLAIKTGMTAGLANGNTVVLDLPSGQVSWQFEESEAHLFEALPAYTKPVEEIELVEMYTRVMNAEI